MHKCIYTRIHALQIHWKGRKVTLRKWVLLKRKGFATIKIHIHTSISPHRNVYICNQKKEKIFATMKINIHTSISPHTNVYIYKTLYMYTYIHIHTYIRVHTYIHIYTCMHIYTYIRIHTYTCPFHVYIKKIVM